MSLMDFGEQFEQMQVQEIRDFTVEVTKKYVDHYSSGDKEYLKRVFHNVSSAVSVLDLPDVARDILLSAALIHDIFTNNDDSFGYLNLRNELIPFMGIVGREVYDDIMLTCEGHKGSLSPIPHLVPPDNVGLWVLPIACQIAKNA